MKKILDYIKVNFAAFILIGALIGGAFYVLLRILACSGDGSSISPATIIIHDTTTVVRYETELKRDTVIKWYERIITVHREPEKIYVQKVDSVFLENLKYKDMMLKIDKKGSTLKIFAVNENDSTLKEYYFENVFSNFTATSAHNNIFVKTNLFKWTGINLSADAFIPVNNTSLKTLPPLRWRTRISSGISFKDRLSLSGFSEYSFMDNKTNIGLELNYKIIR